MPKPKGMFISEVCSLHEIVRELIVMAHYAVNPTQASLGYTVAWLPDMKDGPEELWCNHDCTLLPERFRPGREAPKSSLPDKVIRMSGEVYVMSEQPEAAQPCYVALCKNCQIHFFAAVFDPEDTLENYVKLLKKKGRKR